MEEELGLIGASAEDTEAELIRKICETELLAGNENLLSFAFLAHMKLSLIPTLLYFGNTVFYVSITSSPHCPPSTSLEENLLCAFLPLLVRVCSSPGRYSHPQLTTAACLALSQYMMIRLTHFHCSLTQYATLMDLSIILSTYYIQETVCLNYLETKWHQYILANDYKVRSSPLKLLLDYNRFS